MRAVRPRVHHVAVGLAGRRRHHVPGVHGGCVEPGLRVEIVAVVVLALGVQVVAVVAGPQHAAAVRAVRREGVAHAPDPHPAAARPPTQPPVLPPRRHRVAQAPGQPLPVHGRQRGLAVGVGVVGVGVVGVEGGVEGRVGS